MILVVLVAMGSSCKEAATTIQVTERRELTIWDEGHDPLIAPMPPEWRQVPSTQFRDFNYRFGEDGKGEVYVSRANGGVLENANRWLQQVGKLPAGSVDEFDRIEVLGIDAVLVSVSGDFAGAMGKPAQKDMAVLGVIAGEDDSLLTVKMIGPARLVNAERERMLTFCQNLRVRKNSADSLVNSDSST